MQSPSTWNQCSQTLDCIHLCLTSVIVFQIVQSLSSVTLNQVTEFWLWLNLTRNIPNVWYLYLQFIKSFCSCAIGLNTSCDWIFPSWNCGISENIPQFLKLRELRKRFKGSIWGENMLGYVFAPQSLLVSSSTLLENCSLLSELIVSPEKHLCIFLCQMEAILYVPITVYLR